MYDKPTATRHFSDDRNTSRLEIDDKHVPRRDTYDSISLPRRDRVNHSLARNAIAQIFERQWLESPLLNPILLKIQVWN